MSRTANDGRGRCCPKSDLRGCLNTAELRRPEHGIATRPSDRNKVAGNSLPRFAGDFVSYPNLLPTSP